MTAPRARSAASKAGTKKVASKTAAKKTPAKSTAAKKVTLAESTPAPKKPRVFAIPFASVYRLYVEKVEKKGRTKAELDAVIEWLTGYAGASFGRVIDARADLETFFAEAPRFSPHASLITGIVCGVRVEDVEDPLMRKIRYLDKLVDELARGKKLSSILRA